MANKKNKGLYILLGLIALLTFIGIGLNKLKGKKGIPIHTAKVEKRTIQETVLSSGKIYPKTEVKISSDVSGEVVELYVTEGDTVKAGQLLARIDPEAYVSAVERGRASVNATKAQEANARSQAEGANARKTQAEAQLEQVEAQFKNTQKVYERNKVLLTDGVISQADLDAAHAAYLSASANVKSAQASVSSAISAYNSAQESIRAAGYNINSASASLKELNTNLQRTSIYSRMAGIVSKLNIEKGERVVGTRQMTGTEMMRISDFSVMEAQVDVSETNVLQVNIGNKATIEIDAYPDRKFTGIVSEIGNSASNLGALSISSDQVTNFKVRVLIDAKSYAELIKPNKPFPLRPGMSTNVEIYTKASKGVLSVPIAAVTTREKDDEHLKGEDKIEIVVFQIFGDTVTQQVVKTGIQDDEFIEIITGLADGNEIAKGPYKTVSQKLKNGDKISIKKETANK